MLRGFIDLLTTDGYFQGWAYDSEKVLEPRLVAVLLDDDTEIARGLAHHHREDLVAARCGIGWCGFRLRTRHAISRLRSAPLKLLDVVSARVLHAAEGVRIENANRQTLTTLDEVKAHDPTVLASVAQLSGCDEVYASYIRANGIEGFVRAAYVFILSRPVDPDGLRTYSRLLRLGTITPSQIIKTLSESDEYKATPRELGAPTSPSFPFRPV